MIGQGDWQRVKRLSWKNLSPYEDERDQRSHKRQNDQLMRKTDYSIRQKTRERATKKNKSKPNIDPIKQESKKSARNIGEREDQDIWLGSCGNTQTYLAKYEFSENEITATGRKETKSKKNQKGKKRNEKKEKVVCRKTEYRQKREKGSILECAGKTKKVEWRPCRQKD